MTAPQGPSTADEPFAEAYGAAVQSLRSSLEGAVRAAGGDPERPQELARRFELNKNLTWKVARLIGTPDPAAALRFVPGNTGLRKIRDALAIRASAQSIVDLDRALRRFERMVETHAGDRGSLELLVQGHAHERLEPETLEGARRLAFQGNGAIWGVQARVQLATKILAPNALDPDWVDVCSLGALLDFRRTRAATRWLLFSSQSYEVGTGTAQGIVGEPLLPDPTGRTVAPLLADFSSDPLPEVQVVRTADEVRLELPPGPIGKLGEMSCTYGVVDRRLGPRAMTTPDPQVELGVNLLTPAEQLQLDVLLHDDLNWSAEPRVELFGRIEGRPNLSDEERAGRAIPFGEPLVQIGRGTAGLSSSAVPRNVELVDAALDALGWDPARFRVWRFTMAYPPIPATAVFVMPLPRR